MSYIDENLLAGERVVYRTSMSKAVFLWPALLLLMGVTNLSMLPMAFLVSLGVGVYLYLAYSSSEYAVTNKRVLVKIGILRRRSIEILLPKIEGITVNQGLIGRACGYGTIVVNGTGGTKEPFKMIAAPFDFRRRVQEEIGQPAR